MRKKLSDRFLFVGVPVVVALSVFAVYSSESKTPDLNLLLFAPREVMPGARVPVRAVLFEGLNEIKGPEIKYAPTRVSLMDLSGKTLDAIRLSEPLGLDKANRENAMIGMHGMLKLPKDLRGKVVLRAESGRKGKLLAVVDAPLIIHGIARPLALWQRAQMPLQTYRLEPLRCDEGTCSPDTELELRVIGGMCVPMQSCEVVVKTNLRGHWVMGATNLVTPLGPSEGMLSTEYLVWPLRLNGPEGVVTFSLLEKGKPKAKRILQLPVAQGSTAVVISPRVMQLGAPIKIRVANLIGKGVIVDAFRDGYWERTGSAVVTNDDGFFLPFDLLDEGLWRLQVRTDPLGSENAATRFIRILAKGEESSDATPFAFAMANEELTLLKDPSAMSSVLQATLGKKTSRTRPWLIGMIVIIAASILMTSMLLRRGLRADRQAQEVMHALGLATGERKLGDHPAHNLDDRASRTKAQLTIWAFSLAAGLAVLASALWILARAGHL